MSSLVISKAWKIQNKWINSEVFMLRSTFKDLTLQFHVEIWQFAIIDNFINDTFVSVATQVHHPNQGAKKELAFIREQLGICTSPQRSGEKWTQR